MTQARRLAYYVRRTPVTPPRLAYCIPKQRLPSTSSELRHIAYCVVCEPWTADYVLKTCLRASGTRPPGIAT